ncbi:putative NAD kinase [Babesia sp. Xinjiang]|uniref:putative NAD kinase n=1 Tax=Babesia sp. Xinjiang TaxID=462227 RepID=UPI000A240164|nr:putative NAD kinase [Babesia sp. Xinjiang]ORM39872.1 putative NAD kinase [Babesia sp. Xinjiang]
MPGLLTQIWLRPPSGAFRPWYRTQLFPGIYRRTQRYGTACHGTIPTRSELMEQFKALKINRVMILEKITKYELELRNGLTETEVRKRFPLAYRTHQTHTKIMDEIVRQLNERYHIHTIVVKAHSHNISLIDMHRSAFPPDIIISAGGDGTFLEAAALVPPTKPPEKRLWIVGINTDPERSVGALCLSYFKRGDTAFRRSTGAEGDGLEHLNPDDVPKQNMIRFSDTGTLVRKECTFDTTGAKEWSDIASASFCDTQNSQDPQSQSKCTVLSKHTANIYNLTYDEYVGNLLERLIVKRDYEPVARQKIRIKMLKGHNNAPADISATRGDATCIEDSLFCGADTCFIGDDICAELCDTGNGIMPYGAVNDVIIADKSFGRTFYGLVQVDSSEIMRVKSSGVLVSTGSGSTAWAYNMCKMTTNNGERLFKNLINHPSFPKDAAKKIDQQMMREAIEEHNTSLVFAASQNTLKCIIREGINSKSTVDASTFMGRQVKVLSLSKNARMFIDGSKILKVDYGDVVVMKTFSSDTVWSCL